MIILNFKTYPEATLGDSPIKLAKIAQTASGQFSLPIILCVQASDIFQICQAVSIPVYAQHIDPFEPGKHTGSTTALAVRQDGAAGVLINHSEHRIISKDPKSWQTLTHTIQLAKKNRLKTLVCVESSAEAQKIDRLKPDAIALEDPVLIGGKESIVKNLAGKQKVAEFIARNLKAKSLIGAGVKSQSDVVKALQLGADGILISSGFVKAADPAEVLQDLCAGFNTVNLIER